MKSEKIRKLQRFPSGRCNFIWPSDVSTKFSRESHHTGQLLSFFVWGMLAAKFAAFAELETVLELLLIARRVVVNTLTKRTFHFCEIIL